MNPKFQSLYGLKFNPFRPDVPVEALYATPAVDAFLRRVELGIADGGYIMISGDPGTGKSVVLRLLTQRLRALRDVMVASVPPLSLEQRCQVGPAATVQGMQQPADSRDRPAVSSLAV